MDQLRRTTNEKSNIMQNDKIRCCQKFKLKCGKNELYVQQGRISLSLELATEREKLKRRPIICDMGEKISIIRK